VQQFEGVLGVVYEQHAALVGGDGQAE